MSEFELTAANTIKLEQPLSENERNFVQESRNNINRIINGEDKNRIIVILGPCSIHSYESAIEYAHFVQSCRKKFGSKIELVMRCYFEKPRTRGGWKGLIYDPWIDGSGDIDSGLKLSRRILVKIIELGVPVAHEILDPISHVYFDDLICWGAIGARTVESQIHRQIASNMNYSVGFKNSTEGNTKVAIDAMCSASEPHSYIGVNADSKATRVQSIGNKVVHVVLRGGSEPNYDIETVKKTYKECCAAGFEKGVMVDCSHGNSFKDYKRQVEVVRYLIENKLLGGTEVSGIMIESNLFQGNQSPGPIATLKYGVSITDGCIGIGQTEAILSEIYNNL